MQLNELNNEMSEAIEKTIDIDRILKGKMGAKAKFVPGFVGVSA